MKRLILILIAVCVVAPMAIAGEPIKKPKAPKRENMDMTGCQLWGDVAIAKFYDYYADEKGGWELFCTSVYTFTEWGDVESFEFYNQHGERTCIRKHIYDEQGRTTETHIEWEDMSDTTYTTYTYDGAAITTYQGGTIVTERYNDYGDVVYCHTYGRETNTAETEEYIYHYDGENKVFCEYIINGEPVRRTIYGYDQVGNPIYEYRYFTTDEQPDLKFVYRNDKRGNSVEEIWYHRGDVESQRYTNKYDKQGNVIEMISYPEGRSTPDRKTVTEITYR